MTASRMVLEGMVPVLMHAPPTTERASTTATRFFILVAATAALCPEGPEPMTIRSNLTGLMRCISPGIGCGYGSGEDHQEAAMILNRRVPYVGAGGHMRSA